MNKINIIVLALILVACGRAPQGSITHGERGDYKNLINVKNEPSKVRDMRLNLLADQGSWIGYALPKHQLSKIPGAFVGPSMLTKGWIAPTLAQPILTVNEKNYDFLREIQVAEYVPGMLSQFFSSPEVSVLTELCFESASTAVVRTVITNQTSSEIKISFGWKGSTMDNRAVLKKKGKNVNISNFFDDQVLSVDYITSKSIAITKNNIQVKEIDAYVLRPGQSYKSYYTQTFAYTEKELVRNNVNVEEAFTGNENRWNKYISDLFSDTNSDLLQKERNKRVAVKSMMTLIANWRSPAKDLLFDGSNPSYNSPFSNGVWSWDSWKIASANTLYNPEQAKNEFRSLYAYQAENGMIPDFVSQNKERNNWRDTKPPLSVWGMLNVYNATGDLEFLKEMYPRMVKYHDWWRAERDNDQNGICEYGSTDGTLIAACWESGMDNGVRFDGAIMLNNGKETAWSMNQENICLNSFLYAEKGYLAEIAELLGEVEKAIELRAEAEIIKTHIQDEMFDTETGFFYDTRIVTGEHIKVMGAECWLPLWAGIATPEQAAIVAAKMLDPNKFNATIPLGTLDISHPKLRPEKGYWRGPVWIDQVYFGVQGLRRYGFNEEADMLVQKYIDNAKGLVGDAPIYENYNPLTGEGLNAPNFGWSAATTILMLLNK